MQDFLWLSSATFLLWNIWKKNQTKNHVIFANCKKKNERKIIASPNVVNENKKKIEPLSLTLSALPFPESLGKTCSYIQATPSKVGTNLLIFLGCKNLGWEKK